MVELIKIVAIDIATAVFITKAIRSLEDDERILERIVYGLMAAAWPMLKTISTAMNLEIPYTDFAFILWIPGMLLFILTIQIDNKHRIDKLEEKAHESPQQEK